MGARARVLPLLLLALLAAQGAQAQGRREVPLRVFRSEAQAHAYLMRQAENGLEAIGREMRAVGCTPEEEPKQLQLRCRTHELNSVVLVDFSRRQLVWVDSAMDPLRTGSGVQRVGDALYVMREGELARVDLSGPTARVSDVQQTRLTPDDWSDDTSDEVTAWGNIVVTFDHNRRTHAVLRTFVSDANGHLVPRDTLIVTGDPPVRLDNLATRVRGRTLLLYTSWPVLWEFDESSWLVALSAALPDGQPVIVPSPGWFARVHRPVSGVDPTDALNHVHVLVRCDLGTAPLACTSTMVMAGATRRYEFTDRALEIESVVQRGALQVRLPYADVAPRAFLDAGDTSTRVVRVAGPYRITTTREYAPQRGDSSAGIVDTVSIVQPGTSRSWRVVVPHHVERAVALGSRLLLIGAAKGEVRASLLRMAASAQIVDELRLSNAGADFGNAVLTVHQLGSANAPQYRVGYTVVDFTADTLSNPLDAHNAVWYLEVKEDRLESLGMLRASARTFSEEAEVFTARMRLGESQAMLVGDRVFAIFHTELVEGRIVNGRVQEVARLRLFPEKPPEQ
jgi:hypothetical protein